MAIGCDLRLGMQSLTISNDFPKVFKYGDVHLGLTGLATDVQTMYDHHRLPSILSYISTGLRHSVIR